MPVIKKALAATSIACLFLTNGFSKELFSIDAGFKSAYRDGYITEYVYSNNLLGKSKKLSQLDWNIKNTFQLGGTLQFNLPWFYVNFGASGTIPQNSGRMYDSDWQNLTSTKTDYSINENQIISGLSLDFQIKGKIPVFKKLVIRPSFGLSFEKIHFETKNIEGWYGSKILDSSGHLLERPAPVSYKNPNAVHFPTENNIKLSPVEYESQNLYTWLGGDFEYKPFDFLSAYAGAYFSPFVYHFSIDSHWNNTEKTKISSYYMDEIFSNFNAAKIQAGISYSPIKNLFVNADFSWVRFYESFGDTYSSKRKSSDYSKISGSNSGADSNHITINLSVTYRFFNLIRTDKIRR